MKNLFLIDGASGTGKTDLINYISDYKTRVSYVKKYSTRDVREYEKEITEKLDLIHISEDEFSNMSFDYFYNYGGKKYGFTKEQILNEFHCNEDVFIIVRDIEMIKKLKEDFSFLNVVSVFVYTDKNLIIDRLEKDNHTPEDIAFRIERIEIAFNSYLSNPAYYDEVLINTGTKSHYFKIINDTYEKYKACQNIEQDFIFVLMSFDPKNNEIYDEFVDAGRLVDSKLIIKRIDKQRGDYRITDEILNNISKARLIICDLTDERPNVYYELGYARGLKKPVIACARKGTNIHFDIKDFRTIIYESSGELRKEITSEIKEHLKFNC